MAQPTHITSGKKMKSDWQLFTNDGKFDSKLPPSQRLLRKKRYTLLLVPISKYKTMKPEKAQPQVENVENFVVVWLDNSMGKTKGIEKSKTQLQQIANLVKVFTNANECFAYMSTIKGEKMFVIVSGIVEEKFVSSIHDRNQLESIYVFSPGRTKGEIWFSQYPQMHGIYTTILSLCQQLRKDVKKIDRNLLGFEVMERALANTTSKTRQQDALFMYDQLFRDIVLTVTDENMQDMHEFCQNLYQNNVEEQLFLKTFKQEYSTHSPIWWYSKESCLYRMLNKALRAHDYDTLYLMRVFIRHVHEKIVAQQAKESIGQRKLFRGQGMDKAEFDRLRTSEGGLLSVTNFLSTSANREIGLKFAKDNLVDKRKVSILMEITVEKNTAIPVANITDLSAYKAEQEWLFSIGSVFRIGTLECLPEGIWVVPLTLTDDQDEQLTALKEHFKKSMADKNTCLNFGRLMRQLASWKKSEYFYLKALETETTSQRRSVLFNDIAMTKGELEKYDEAFDYYQRSLELKEEAGSDSASDKATTYNNIATLYYKQNKMDQAIEYFQKALEACNAQGNNNEALVATLHANIAAILDDQGKYDEALEKCEESLKIRIKIFPAIHPTLASTYGTIANIMHHMESHEKAIAYAQKALDIDRQALPPDHPQTLLHTNNLEVFKQYQSK